MYWCSPAVMSVHGTHAWCPRRPEEDNDPTGTGISDGCELPIESKRLRIESKSSARAATSSLNYCAISTCGPVVKDSLDGPLWLVP